MRVRDLVRRPAAELGHQEALTTGSFLARHLTVLAKTISSSLQLPSRPLDTNIRPCRGAPCSSCCKVPARSSNAVTVGDLRVGDAGSTSMKRPMLVACLWEPDRPLFFNCEPDRPEAGGRREDRCARQRATVLGQLHPCQRVMVTAGQQVARSFGHQPRMQFGV